MFLAPWPAFVLFSPFRLSPPLSGFSRRRSSTFCDGATDGHFVREGGGGRVLLSCAYFVASALRLLPRVSGFSVVAQNALLSVWRESKAVFSALRYVKTAWAENDARRAWAKKTVSESDVGRAQCGRAFRNGFLLHFGRWSMGTGRHVEGRRRRQENTLGQQ